jgi:sulfonate transport system substrate-binding protein
MNWELGYRRLSRRTFLATSMALTALGAGELGPQVTAQGGEIRLGFQKFSTTLLVLKAQQVLEDKLGALGYTVSWVEFPAGPPLLEALNAGSIDFGATGAPPPVFAQAAGTDLVYAFASRPSPQNEGILVPGDSAISNVVDLAGKKVAVAKGSNAHALLVGALQGAGLAPEDIQFVFLAPADAKPAFTGGNVEAWSIWDPYYALEQDDSGAHSIATAEDVGQPNRTFYLAARPFATENPKALAALGAAIDDAETWSAEHAADVAKLVSTETGIAEATLLKAEERRGFGLEPAVTADIIVEQQELADLFQSLGLIPKPIEVAQATLNPASSPGS